MLTKTIRTDNLPVSQRLRYLRSSMSALSFDCIIEPTGDEPINTRMTAHVAPEFRLVEVTFTAHRTANITRSRPRRAADTFLVSLQQAGSVTVHQDGRDARIDPKQFFVIDTTRPFSIETGPMRSISLYMSREQLQPAFGDGDEFTATAISAKRGTGALFGTMLEQLFRNVPHIDDRSSERIAHSLPHLLAAALHSPGGDNPHVAPASEAARIQQIRAYALAHLGDSDLDAASIARGVSLSLRQVHQLFENQPVTLMRWVWSERLQRCHAQLAGAARHERPISEIAFSWGFTDSAHFSRAFKNAFGLSPRAFRTSMRQRS